MLSMGIKLLNYGFIQADSFSHIDELCLLEYIIFPSSPTLGRFLILQDGA